MRCRPRGLDMSTPERWKAALRHRVAMHDLIVAGDRMLGRTSPQAQQARLAVVAAIDEAAAAGASEADIDAVLADARSTQPGTMEP